MGSPQGFGQHSLKTEYSQTNKKALPKLCKVTVVWHVFLHLRQNRNGCAMATQPLSPLLPASASLLIVVRQTRVKDIGLRVDGGLGGIREKSNFFLLTSNLGIYIFITCMHDLLVSVDNVQIVFEKYKIRLLYLIKTYCLSLWLFLMWEKYINQMHKLYL